MLQLYIKIKKILCVYNCTNSKFKVMIYEFTQEK